MFVLCTCVSVPYRSEGRMSRKRASDTLEMVSGSCEPLCGAESTGSTQPLSHLHPSTPKFYMSGKDPNSNSQLYPLICVPGPQNRILSAAFKSRDCNRNIATICWNEADWLMEPSKSPLSSITHLVSVYVWGLFSLCYSNNWWSRNVFLVEKSACDKAMWRMTLTSSYKQ